jgi:hypothetical protein
MLSHPPQWRLVALAISLGWLAAARAETTSLYRCTTLDGRIEFRQSACAEHSEQQKVLVNHDRSGWVPPKPRSDPAPKSAPQQPDATRIDRRASAQARREQAHACWKARADLDEVNRQLRYGYKASQGAKLRNKRRRYEAYLRNLCSQ